MCRRLSRSDARRPALGAVVVWLAALLAPAAASVADTVTVAVAANFRVPLEALGRDFEAATGHTLTIVAGSTGQLYAQIVNGAPFDVLLAADQARPRLLADAGLGDPSTLFTYAVGRLALWSAEPDRIDDETLAALGDVGFRWLAIANPDVAPYGEAARQTLAALGLWDALEPRIVRGQSIAQAFAMAQTGNAELGFVALSQAIAYEGPASYTVVPQALHAPISQDAIVLERSAMPRAAAAAFIEFLRSAEASATIERFGYGHLDP